MASRPAARGMNVQMWAIEKPIPYARNRRQIPQIAIDKVAASIREFGFRQPIVVDEKGVVIVGHARLLGAHKLGLTQVPVHVAAGLTEAQVKAYRLADNRTNQEAFWDMDALALELADLKVDEFDLDLTGFNWASPMRSPSRPANVAEPIRVFILDYFAYELCAAELRLPVPPVGTAPEGS